MQKVRRRFASVMGAVAGLSPFGAALGQRDDLEAFRAEVLDVLHRKYPAMKAVAAQEVGVIEIDEGSIGLQNLHAMAGSLPARKRQAAIADFLKKMRAMAPSRLTGLALSVAASSVKTVIALGVLVSMTCPA